MQLQSNHLLLLLLFFLILLRVLLPRLPPFTATAPSHSHPAACRRPRQRLRTGDPQPLRPWRALTYSRCVHLSLQRCASSSSDSTLSPTEVDRHCRSAQIQGAGLETSVGSAQSFCRSSSRQPRGSRSRCVRWRASMERG